MDDFFEQIWQKRGSFLITFFVVFLLSYLLLLAVDFLPEPPAESNDSETKFNIGEDDVVDERDVRREMENEAKTDDEEVSLLDDKAEGGDVLLENEIVMPLSIFIKKINKTVPVLNPTSRTIADLDTALLEGVVRHPDSATLGRAGSVFILGHSSYLPTVFNSNFQAFNGIQDLEWGDVIEVSSADSVYEYKVEKVYRAVAQDLTVPIAGEDKKLTLATCNSFGSVDDRYIVEAKQVSVKRL